MKDRKEIFIKKAIKTHGNKYVYSKIEYINSQSKVCIICPEHGEFWQTPSAHVRGNGCPMCSRKKQGKCRVTTQNLIEKCKTLHKNKYTYEKTEYIDSKTKIFVTCSTHGDFEILPFNHLKGQGCPKCKGKNLTQEELIKKFREIHDNKYDYSKMCFTKIKEKVCIICPEHGEFWQTPQKHLKGQGCAKCSYEKKILTSEDFLKKSFEIHGNKYINSNIEYKNNKTKVKLLCPIHGEFWQTPSNHLQGCGCPKCGNNISKGEQSLKEFIKNILHKKVITKNKTIISPYELDIYIPDKKIAIEYNGLRWHSEQFKEDKDYHLIKTELCEKQGIRLIHIFEDEWLYKQDIVKSRLKNIFGLTENKIYARKCTIKEITHIESKDFLEGNHIQGNVNGKYKYGLYYNHELVSLMTFGPKRKSLGSKSDTDVYELLRFCNKINTKVIGGASKLFSHFIKTHKPKEIVSYCDRRWSQGNLYEKMGFSFNHVSQPNYFYVVNGKRENRFKYRKSELIKQGFDKNKTEHEIMLECGIYRIYDCGTKVYIWKGEDV